MLFLIDLRTNRVLLDDVEKSASLMDKFCNSEPLEAVDRLAAQMGHRQVRATVCEMWYCMCESSLSDMCESFLSGMCESSLSDMCESFLSGM